MTSAQREWAARVRAWKQSGQSMRAFCQGKPFKLSTFRWWKRRLSVVGEVPRATEPDVRMVRVVPIRKAELLAEVEVHVAGARVVVRSGFNPVLLREVVAALEVAG